MEHKGHTFGRFEWTPERLAKLQADYEDDTVTLVQLAQKYQTSISRICILSRQMGWEPRAQGSQTVAPQDRVNPMLARRKLIVDQIKALQQELHYLDRRIFLVQAAVTNPQIDEGDVKL